MNAQKHSAHRFSFPSFIVATSVKWKFLSRAFLVTWLVGFTIGGVVSVQAALAPVISTIPDQITNEDEPILDVPFTVLDPDTPLDQLRFSTLFTFIPQKPSSPGDIVIRGTGTNRWLSIHPLPDAAGLAQASITVSDGTGLSATARFQVQVNPLNDPPRLSAIPNQTALKGQGTFSVPFLTSDPDTSAGTLRLTAWSSRQSVVNNAGLQIVQGITNRTLLITLSSTGSVGSTAVTIQADDRQVSNTVSFVLNVHPPEFGRSSNAITASATSFQPIWGDFNGDGLLDLVASAFSIQTNRGGGLFGQGIQLPAAQASSAAAADFDGDGDLDLLFYGTTTVPRLLRNNGGGSPAFSDVSTNWGSLQAYRGPLQWTDMDGDGDLDILGGTNDIRWLRSDGTGGFTDTGTGIPSRTVLGMLAVGDFDNDGDPDVLAHTFSFVTPPYGGPRLYLNDGMGRLIDSQIPLPQGLTKAAGWTDIDNDGSLDLWLVQTAQPFNLTTNSLVVLRQVSGRFVETFRLNDAASIITVIQPVLAPPWADFDNDGDVDFVGRFWSRLSPVGNFTNYPSLYRNNGDGQFTTTGLPIAIDTGQPLALAGDFDDNGAPDLLYRTGTTSGAWLPMRNQSPSLNPLPGAPWGLHAFVADDIVTFFWNDADDANQSSGLTYNVRVGTAPRKNDVVPSMSTTNGTRMVPARGNAENNNWKMVNLPLERFNTEKLYWTVQAVDNGFQGGPFAPEQTFFINPPGNLPPSIFGISDLTISEDTTGNLTLYVTDDRTDPSALHVQATSSNTNVLSSAGVRLSGFTNTAQGLRINLSLTPLADRVGETTITVTVTDRGGLTTSRFFVVTVTPVNDPPSVTAAESLLALAGAATPPLAVSAVDKESPVEQLRLTARSLSPQIVPDANIAATRTALGWQVVATPTFSGAAQATIELSVQDPQGAEAKRSVTVRFQQYLMTSLAGEPVSGWPTPFIWADFNADRKLDLLAGYVAGLGLTVHEVQDGGLPLRARLTPLFTNGVPIDVGDFDNDGDVDVLASTSVNEGDMTVSKLVVYRNLGNFAFEQVPGAVFNHGAARFADFDRDGRVDVCVAENSTGLVVYRSNGMGSDAGRSISLTTSNLPPFASPGNLNIADLDGDGLAELLMTAYTENGPRQIVYRRQGDTFEQTTGGWTSYPIQDLADFDQDRSPDLVEEYLPSGVMSTWKNLGGLNFVQSGPTFVNWNSRAAVADFDGDGVPDVMEYGSSFNRIHLGQPNFTFDILTLPFAQANVFISVPADFDGNGVMDLAVSMISYAPETSGPPQIAVYRGQSQRTNSIPASPTNLRASDLSSNGVRLSWNFALDTNQSGGLTYNTRVGTAPGLGDVVSPMSLTDGYRLVARVGNAGWNTNFILMALQPGHTYYWSVQAVDNSFAGGPFAPEASFTMPQAVLAWHTVSDSNLELELRAGPDTSWRLEMSSDLKNWLDYPAPGVMLRTTTNGADRASIPISVGRQFFRARRVDY